MACKNGRGKGKAASSLVARLNVRLFFRLLGIYLLLDLLLIALFFQSFKEYPLVENIFKGIRPGVVALIAAPTFTVAKSSKINRFNVWIPILGALLIWAWGFSPIYVIVLAGVGGYCWGRYQNHKQAKS